MYVQTMLMSRQMRQAMRRTTRKRTERGAGQLPILKRMPRFKLKVTTTRANRSLAGRRQALGR